MASCKLGFSQFECPVCMEIMDVNNKPILMPCQHTVCQTCIQAIEHKCPICRKTFDQDDLPINLTMIQLHDLFSNISVTSDRKQCDFCIDTTQYISHYCKECNDYFCTDCASKHQTNPVHLGHKTVEMAAAVSSCSNHNRGFSMFCLDCNTLLCPVCVHQNVCCTRKNKYPLADIKTVKTQEIQIVISGISAEIKVSEEENKSYLNMLKSCLKTGEQTKHKLQEHIEILRKKLKQEEEILLAEIELWEKHVHAIKVEAEKGIDVEMLHELKERAEVSLTGGIEHILLTLPSIQTGIHHAVSKRKQKIIPGQITFKPDITTRVGDVHVDEVGDYESIANNHATVSGDEHKQIELISSIERPGLGSGLWDLVFIKETLIAVSDWRRKLVSLIDKEGYVLSDSKKQEIQFQCPRGITYHQGQDCLVVCDQDAGCLAMLDADTLTLKGRVQLPKCSPCGIAVLPSGDVVVTNIKNKKVGVFDMNGTQLLSTSPTNSCASPFIQPCYVAVDRDNNIYVADFGAHKIVKLNERREKLCEWMTDGYPGGMVVYGDKVLVAEYGPPDCVREYSLDGGVQGKQLLTWPTGGRFGNIRSIAIQWHHLAIIGWHGLKIY